MSTSRIGRHEYKPHPIADGNPYKMGTNLKHDPRMRMTSSNFLQVISGPPEHKRSNAMRLVLGNWMETLI